jgi:sulfur dioxygenase
MLFRQMFDSTSSTYTYLLASRVGGEALIIDHITALGDLRDVTQCVTIMGELSKAHCVSRHVHEDEVLGMDGIELRAIYTPGHTDESFSFVLNPKAPTAVFTGDVLLIRGSGRTDFQGGDPRRSYDSIVNKLFRLPDDTTLYPAHDYKGWTASSIGEEKKFNPRLAGKTEAEYVGIMNGLHLPNPKMMDVAIPANLACGQPSVLPKRQG